MRIGFPFIKIFTNKNESKEVILASFTVLADIISNVTKDNFIVRSITKPGVEVHGYQPTPSDLVNASNAFVFIDNGFGFESVSYTHLTLPTNGCV